MQRNILKSGSVYGKILLCKYHDGYRLMNYHTQTFVSDTLFYPFEWLKAVGFFVQEPDFSQTTWTYTVDPPLSTHPKPTNSPVPTVSVNAETRPAGDSGSGPAATGVAYPNPSIQYMERTDTIVLDSDVSAFTLFTTVLLCGAIVSPIAVLAGKRLAHSQKQYEYQPIANAH